MNREVDVLLVGAGLAGIGVAYHLQKNCPEHTYAILEGRAALGGTWDLFRYPGIRSDSRMHLYGYSFRPWTDDRSIAPGEVILKYLQDTAREEGIEPHIRYQTRATRARWSSERARWTVEAVKRDTGERVTYSARWLQMCSGYYSYQGGYTPAFAGREDFQGQIIHPQAWPEDFDGTGKRICVIGSGATAVTLIPSLAKTAKHVVMLQRSPSYIHVEPSRDLIAMGLQRLLPDHWAYALTRKKNLYLERLGYDTARNKPDKLKKYLFKRIRKALPKGYDVERHFTPKYQPWDQRLCLSPDGDLFQAISSGDASVITADIDRFTASGVRLTNGEEVPADVIITATGLKMLIGGEMEVEVDGQKIHTPDTWIYKGVMLSGIPNMMLTAGTLIASYTLRVELIAEYLCRLLQHMKETGARVATPELPVAAADMPKEPFVSGFNSGYLLRAIDTFPKQGPREPWRNVQSFQDNRRILEGPVNDGVLAFEGAAVEAPIPAHAAPGFSQ